MSIYSRTLSALTTMIVLASTAVATGCVLFDQDEFYCGNEENDFNCHDGMYVGAPRVGSPCGEIGEGDLCGFGDHIGLEVCTEDEEEELVWSSCYLSECETVGEVKPCYGPTGEEWVSHCIDGGGLVPRWGACAPDVCTPGVHECSKTTSTWTCFLDEVGAPFSVNQICE